MPKILFVANVAKEHMLKFHIPTIKALKDNGWVVDVACSGEEIIPHCDNKWTMDYKRSPFHFKTITNIIKLRRIIDNEKYDIIHCHTATGGVVARIASTKSRKNGSKVIYTAHGYHFYKGAPLLNWLVFFPIEWLLSMITDSIITINTEDYTNTKKFKFQCKDIYKVNGIGVKLNKFNGKYTKSQIRDYRENLLISDNTLVLTYVAELTENKNQEFLLRMMSVLINKKSNCLLLLVGPDHMGGRLQHLASQLGVAEHVRFLGWRDDIDRLLSISDIVVASSKREGLGLNIVEAMASKVPVIAVENRGHSEVIKNGKTGFTISKDNITEMVDTILLLVTNNILKNKIIEAASEDISKFDEKIIIRQLLDIYNKTIKIV